MRNSPATQAAADRREGLVAAALGAVMRGIEEVIAVLAGELGLVHRQVGLAQQLVGVDFLGLRVQGQADARRDLHLLPCE